MTKGIGRLLMAGVTSLAACSGRFEVGGMDQAAGSGSARSLPDGSGGAGGATSGTGKPAVAGSSSAGVLLGDSSGGSMAVGSGMAVGGTMAIGEAGPATPANEFGPQCLPSGAPPALAGPFAEPAAVWERVAMLTWGQGLAPLTPLPDTTTYAWAGALARSSIASVRKYQGTVPGIELFVRQALGVDATSTLLGKWEAVAQPDQPLLEALLLSKYDSKQQRVGIFTEPSWLTNHLTISSRGFSIESQLFNRQVPRPPAGVVVNVDASLPDRDALQVAIVNPVCQGCHQIMDPSGLALGHFGADGNYRELDHGLPIDVSAAYPANMDGSQTSFDGIADFGLKVADTCAATLGIADTFLRAALVLTQVPEGQRDALFAANQTRVQQAFVNGGRSYEALVSAYMQSSAGLQP